MKLSFSTLGCPRWTLKEVVATAKDLGFGGVEIRGIGDKINALEIPEFSDAEIEQTKEKIAQTGLVIPSLTSGATLAVRDRAQDSFLEACGYIDLARKRASRTSPSAISRSAQGSTASCANTARREASLR